MSNPIVVKKIQFEQCGLQQGESSGKHIKREVTYNLPVLVVRRAVWSATFTFLPVFLLFFVFPAGSAA